MERSGDDHHHHHHHWQDKGNLREAGRIWQQTDSVKRRWCLLVCFYFTFRIQSVRERQTGRHVRYDRDEDPNNWFCINQCKKTDSDTSVPTEIPTNWTELNLWAQCWRPSKPLWTGLIINKKYWIKTLTLPNWNWKNGNKMFLNNQFAIVF